MEMLCKILAIPIIPCHDVLVAKSSPIAHSMCYRHHRDVYQVLVHMIDYLHVPFSWVCPSSITCHCPKFLKFFMSMAPMCWVIAELNPVGCFLTPTLIELCQQVEPEFNQKFWWSKLSDGQKAKVGLLHQITHYLAHPWKGNACMV